MFESQQSAPWYRSITGVIATALLLPPVGLALLWTRPQTPVRRKILFSLCIVLLGAGYFYLFSAWRRSSANETHYALVEQHRAQQQREALAQPAANDPAASTASPSPQPGLPAGQQAAVPAPASSTDSVAAHVGRNYWTNFRGPNRDGRYDEMAVLTNWPAQGLSLVWKEPVGLGYASFTIADGRAYTIEQRRRQEVVAAYDVNTGREL
jgi:hypothetical protein